MELVNPVKLCFCIKERMVAANTSDYVHINITMAMITVDSFRQLQVHFSF